MFYKYLPIPSPWKATDYTQICVVGKIVLVIANPQPLDYSLHTTNFAKFGKKTMEPRLKKDLPRFALKLR